MVVHFQRLDKGGQATVAIRLEVSLTHLGQLRTGSIWRDGKCESFAKLETADFDLDFSPAGGRQPD